MKNIFLLLTLVGTITIANGQVYVQKVNINEAPTNFISIYTNTLTQSHCPLIDYGQESRSWKSMRVTDSNGEKRKFSSMTSVIDFLDKNGWILVELNTDKTVTIDSKTSTTHFTNKEGEKVTHVHHRLKPSSSEWYYFLFKRKDIAVSTTNE